MIVLFIFQRVFVKLNPFFWSEFIMKLKEWVWLCNWWKIIRLILLYTVNSGKRAHVLLYWINPLLISMNISHRKALAIAKVMAEFWVIHWVNTWVRSQFCSPYTLVTQKIYMLWKVLIFPLSKEIHISMLLKKVLITEIIYLNELNITECNVFRHLTACYLEFMGLKYILLVISW